jgi:hypothetical protein
MDGLSNRSGHRSAVRNVRKTCDASSARPRKANERTRYAWGEIDLPMHRSTSTTGWLSRALTATSGNNMVIASASRADLNDLIQDPRKGCSK